MTKDAKRNAEMQTKEEFDRSICMMFFGNYRSNVKRIERRFGVELAYKVQSAIIDYGLFGIMPEDEDIIILVNDAVFDMIDRSQANRARGFAGEDLEMSKKIIRSHLDRPDLSQDKLAKLLHTSKGKVNKTLKKYRNGEYEGIINLDENINVNNSDNINDDVDLNVSTDRDCRDRQSSQSTETASPITESETPTSPPQTELSEMEIYKNKVSVINLFRNHKRPIEIVNTTGFEYGFVNSTIDDYKSNGYKFPDKPKEVKQLDIPLMDGSYYWLTKKELFDITTDNGTKSIEDIDWSHFEHYYIMDGMNPFDVKKLIKEFQHKLNCINDMKFLERIATN